MFEVTPFPRSRTLLRVAALLLATAVAPPAEAGGCQSCRDSGGSLFPETLQPHLWRIGRFHYHRDPPTEPGGARGKPEARFTAHFPPGGQPGNLEVGEPVLLYELVRGQVRLAGSGRVREIEGPPAGPRRVQAAIQGFRHAERFRHREHAGAWKISDGVNPRRARWFMASSLIGPDVAGWDEAEMRTFLSGRIRPGMSERALFAITGQPYDRMEMGYQTRYMFAGGPVTGVWIAGGRVQSTAGF